MRLKVADHLRGGEARWFVDCCAERSGQGMVLGRSLGEELASPKTPSRIFPVDSAILENKGLIDIEYYKMITRSRVMEEKIAVLL